MSKALDVLTIEQLESRRRAISKRFDRLTQDYVTMMEAVVIAGVEALTPEVIHDLSTISRERTVLVDLLGVVKNHEEGLFDESPFERLLGMECPPEIREQVIDLVERHRRRF